MSEAALNMRNFMRHQSPAGAIVYECILQCYDNMYRCTTWGCEKQLIKELTNYPVFYTDYISISTDFLNTVFSFTLIFMCCIET